MTPNVAQHSVVLGPGLTALACQFCENDCRATIAPTNELAGRANANVLVLGGQSAEGESAILTAAKVRLVHPATRVVILGSESLRGSADQLGVTLLPSNASVSQILGLVAA